VTQENEYDPADQSGKETETLDDSGAFDDTNNYENRLNASRNAYAVEEPAEIPQTAAEQDESAPTEPYKTFDESDDFWGAGDDNVSVTRTETTRTETYEQVVSSEDVVSNQNDDVMNDAEEQYSITSPSEDTVVEVDSYEQQVMEPVEDFWGSG